MAVPAVGGVGDDDLGRDLLQHRGQRVDLVGERVRRRERARVQPGRRRGAHAVPGEHHAGVAPAAGSAEEPVVGDAQRGAGGRELADPVAAELVRGVGGEQRQLGRDDLALLAERARHEGDRRVRVGGVAGHGAAGRQRLVVGMGVHQQQPAARGGRHAAQPMRHPNGGCAGPAYPRSTSRSPAKWHAARCPSNGRGPVTGASGGGSSMHRRRSSSRELLVQPAAGAEPAAARRVRRARHLAAQHDALPRPLHRRVRDRHRRDQRLGVRVVRALEQRVAVRGLDDRAQVHHRDPVADVPDHRQVVGDEQVRQPEVVLQLLQQVEHLRLDRHVQRGHRLVEHHELRVRARSPGRSRRAGAARRRTRAGSGRRGRRRRPTVSSRSGIVEAVSSPPSSAYFSARIWRTVMRGFSEAYGSWKTICMSARALPQLLRRQRRDVAPGHRDRAAGRLLQAQDRPGDRRLAAARLADQRQRRPSGPRASRRRRPGRRRACAG